MSKKNKAQVSLVVWSTVSATEGYSGFAGHALIRLKTTDGKNYIFHATTPRENTSRLLGQQGGLIYAGQGSIEFICCNGGSFYSVGGLKGAIQTAPSLTDDQVNQYYEKKKCKATPLLRIDGDKAWRMLYMIIRLARNAPSKNDLAPGSFSVIGGLVRLGTNCITWSYILLKEFGVTFDYKLYAYSFYSPRIGVENGGTLQLSSW
jgi:hypothetical protein